MITVDVTYNAKGSYHELTFVGKPEDKDKLDTILACMADTQPPRKGVFIPSAPNEVLLIRVADLSAIPDKKV